VLPFVLRRTKESVARELPSKTIVDIPCALSDVQRKMYAAFTQSMGLALDSKSSDDVLESALLASITAKLAGGKQAALRSQSNSQPSIHPFKVCMLYVYPYNLCVCMYAHSRFTFFSFAIMTDAGVLETVMCAPCTGYCLDSRGVQDTTPE
jgi:hypothetical protein